MPQRSRYRVVVIGAGFGGIGMAVALKQAGIEDFVVLDRGDDLGGIWRDNTYPGRPGRCGHPMSEPKGRGRRLD